MKINKIWLRFFGICGILGGIVLFAGDMLLYYNTESTNLLENMSYASDFRIKISGVFALLAAWFYVIGLGQIYYAFKPTTIIPRSIVVLTFGGILIGYGVVHGAYIAIATTAKIAVQYQLNMASVTRLATEVNNTIRMLIYPLFAILSVVFIQQVWTRKTLYPRWILFFFPLLPFLFQGLIGDFLEGSLRVIIIGGFLNIILIVFFSASTISLWHSEIKDTHEQ